MEHIACFRNPFLTADNKEHAAPFDNRNLFVRMMMRLGDRMRGKAQPADHESFTDDQLPFNSVVEVFDRNALPIEVLWGHS
jgi:hypothetical protein